MSKENPMKKSYWTVWNPSGVFQVCSEHRSSTAAINAAKKCEAKGGAPHIVVEVRVIRDLPTTK